MRFEVLAAMSKLLDFAQDSGFKPLRKAHSEPVKNLMDRLSGVGFVMPADGVRVEGSPGGRERKPIFPVDKDPWKTLTKRASFGHQGIGAVTATTSPTKGIIGGDNFKPLVKRRSMSRGGNPAVIVIDPFR